MKLQLYIVTDASYANTTVGRASLTSQGSIGPKEEIACIDTPNYEA